MGRHGVSVFDAVRAVIAKAIDVEPDRIAMDTDVAGDLGAAEDDGEALIYALSDEFDIDWSGMNVDLHFGRVDFLPMPWRIAGS